MPHADDQDGGGTQRRGEPHEQAIAALEQREADARRHPLARAAQEPVGLTRLLPERLDHAQRPERLLHDGGRRALELLRVS